MNTLAMNPRRPLQPACLTNQPTVCPQTAAVKCCPESMRWCTPALVGASKTLQPDQRGTLSLGTSQECEGGHSVVPALTKPHQCALAKLIEDAGVDEPA
jgi:hypothetical protein